MSGMKSATLKKPLKNRIDDWLKTITDAKLVEAIKKDVIVSGGCIASGLLGEKINDYDYYFRTRETALATAKYYVEVFNKNKAAPLPGSVPVIPHVKEEVRLNCKGQEENRIIIYMKSAGVLSETQNNYQYFESKSDSTVEEFFGEMESALESKEDIEVGEELVSIVRSSKDKYRPVFLSENAITLSNQVQLVVRFYGEASKLHENYDFAHAMCWFDYNNNDLVMPHEALESLLSKTLIYKGSLYPIASLFRIRKFISRGWRISAGQMLKIIFQVNKLDLENPLVLREQLIGVDMAYMSQLLSVIAENKSQRIDSIYIAKLIDEIFE
jgi:hypothetical protein